MPLPDKYKAALIEKVTTGASLKTLLLEFALATIAPEVALPALFITFLSDITSSPNIANYTQILANLTTVVDRVLSILERAQRLKFIGDDQADSLKRIADALYVREGTEDIPIAHYMKNLSTYTPASGSNEGEEMTLVQILYAIYGNTYLKLEDGKFIPFADALTADRNNGLFRFFNVLPLDGSNGG